MRTPRQASLQAVTLETVATTAKAAEHAVRAYRAGGHRLIAVIHNQVATPVALGTERVAPRLADVVRRSGSQAGVLAAQGIDAVSDRSGAAIGAVSSGVATQVKRMASVAEGVSNPLLAQGLDAAARLSLPAAQAALALTERVAELAARLPQAPQAAQAGKTTKANKIAKKAKATPARPVTARRRPAATVQGAVQASVKRSSKAAQQVAKQAAGQAKGAVRQAAASKPVKAVRAKVAATRQSAVRSAKAAVAPAPKKAPVRASTPVEAAAAVTVQA